MMSWLHAIPALEGSIFGGRRAGGFAVTVKREKEIETLLQRSLTIEVLKAFQIQ